jgi:hypothetical protein
MEATKAQLLKQAIGAMVAVGMRPMPLKVIGRKACLRVKGIFEGGRWKCIVINMMVIG